MHIKQREGNTSALAYHYSPLLTRIYANRGVDNLHQLDYSLKHLTPYTALKGIKDACQLIADVLQSDGSIMIVGDYDCDGATSTSLALLALGAMGAQRVGFRIPDRFQYGYGLTAPLVESIVAEHPQQPPSLIITVDNGIASHAGIAKAQTLGIKVLVTDHHLPGDTLPDADTIVNPNQPDCDFPHKGTAGVGVIFYVMSALRQHLLQQDWFNEHRPAPNMAQFLDLVALGTVADLVPLEHNNRIMVAQGLARIRQGQARPGVMALIEAAGKQAKDLQATDIGFVIAPRLNAAGRIDNMSIGIECLITQSQTQAQSLANQLDQLNRERRSIQSDMQAQAEQAVQTSLSQPDAILSDCVCLYHDEWHEGIVGIVASRIKERWCRPAIVFAKGEDGLLKGSARSVTGFHIRDALAAIDAQNPDLIVRFGGHAMAAGLTLREEHLTSFEQALLAYTSTHLDAHLLESTWLSDGTLTAEQLCLGQVYEIQQAGPWGQHFEAPIFHGNFRVLQQRIVGEKHLKLVLTTSESSDKIDAIFFNADLGVWPNSCQNVRAVYRLDVNQFRGRHSLQLMINALQPLENTALP